MPTEQKFTCLSKLFNMRLALCPGVQDSLWQCRIMALQLSSALHLCTLHKAVPRSWLLHIESFRGDKSELCM